VKAKGTIFSIVYRRLVLRLGHAKPSVPSPTGSVLSFGFFTKAFGTRNADQVRASKMIRELRTLGYRVELASGASIA